MMSQDLERIAAALVAQGKGILAADESVPTLTKRFDTLGIRRGNVTIRSFAAIFGQRVGQPL